MMHKDRVWCVVPVVTDIELAVKLTQYSWCCCGGFELEGYLWLNDATGADGAQEYACVRKPTDKDPHYRQVESITVSWCTEQQVLAYIRSIHGDDRPLAVDGGPVVITRSGKDLATALGFHRELLCYVVKPKLESPEQHGRCHHCA